MNQFGFEPDFENLKTVLLGGKGYRVPFAELVIDSEVKEAFLGKKIVTPADEVEFRYQAGYDYAWVSVGMIDPAGTVNKDSLHQSEERHFAGADQRVWADEHGGVIRDRESLEAYPWPAAVGVDYSPVASTASHLREGMKLIAVLGKIFTASWQLVGFVKFCEMTVTNPELVSELTSRVGSLQVEVFKRVIEMDSVGAVWIPDDIAFHTGLLLEPDWFRRHVFPYYKQMTDIAKRKGKPVIFHSDGNLFPVLDDILAAGFDGLHPIEPESMDIYELRKIVKDKICLVGNISVNTLSIGTIDEIRDLVTDRVTHLGYKGAYCLGSSNSVPNYVPCANYRAMLETGAENAIIP